MIATAQASGKAAVLILLLSLVLPCLFAFSAYAEDIELLSSWASTEDGEQFGIRVAIGGDFNGDGKADLAVGASTNDEAGNNAGRVAIYFGGSAPSEDPDLELFGSEGSFFGGALAWPGDIDGDGYDDLLVGAFRAGDAGENAGKAYLFLGGEEPDSDPDLILLGPAEGAYFGRGVAGLGDVNGDGYCDFAVGAPRTTNGNVYVYFGGPVLDGTADLILEGPEEDCRFGESVAGLGPIDGNTGNDFAAGAPRLSIDHLWRGGVFVYSGGSGLDETPDLVVIGDEPLAQFGTSVAPGGDINGDGSPDMLVGAPYRNNDPTIDCGAVFVFYGGAGFDDVPDFVFFGANEDDNLGMSVAGCGDATSNGYDDILAGAPRVDYGGMDVGMAVVIPGGSPPSGSEALYFYGEDANDQFGLSVAGIACCGNRSFTGSPDPDFAVGAWGHGIGGKAYVYGQPGSGSAAPEPLAESILTLSLNPSSRFTFSTPQAGKSPLRLSILSVDGALVNILEGAGTVIWEGTDEEGRPVPAGTYFYVATTDRGRCRGRVLLIR